MEQLEARRAFSQEEAVARYELSSEEDAAWQHVLIHFDQGVNLLRDKPLPDLPTEQVCDHTGGGGDVGAGVGGGAGGGGGVDAGVGADAAPSADDPFGAVGAPAVGHAANAGADAASGSSSDDDAVPNPSAPRIPVPQTSIMTPVPCSSRTVVRAVLSPEVAPGVYYLSSYAVAFYEPPASAGQPARLVVIHVGDWVLVSEDGSTVTRFYTLQAEVDSLQGMPTHPRRFLGQRVMRLIGLQRAANRAPLLFLQPGRWLSITRTPGHLQMPDEWVPETDAGYGIPESAKAKRWRQSLPNRRAVLEVPSGCVVAVIRDTSRPQQTRVKWQAACDDGADDPGHPVFHGRFSQESEDYIVNLYDSVPFRKPPRRTSAAAGAAARVAGGRGSATAQQRSNAAASAGAQSDGSTSGDDCPPLDDGDLVAYARDSTPLMLARRPPGPVIVHRLPPAAVKLPLAPNRNIRVWSDEQILTNTFTTTAANLKKNITLLVPMRSIATRPVGVVIPTRQRPLPSTRRYKVYHDHVLSIVLGDQAPTTPVPHLAARVAAAAPRLTWDSRSSLGSFLTNPRAAPVSPLPTPSPRNPHLAMLSVAHAKGAGAGNGGVIAHASGAGAGTGGVAHASGAGAGTGGVAAGPHHGSSAASAADPATVALLQKIADKLPAFEPRHSEVQAREHLFMERLMQLKYSLGLARGTHGGYVTARQIGDAQTRYVQDQAHETADKAGQRMFEVTMAALGAKKRGRESTAPSPPTSAATAPPGTATAPATSDAAPDVGWVRDFAKAADEHEARVLGRVFALEGIRTRAQAERLAVRRSQAQVIDALVKRLGGDHNMGTVDLIHDAVNELFKSAVRTRHADAEAVGRAAVVGMSVPDDDDQAEAASGGAKAGALPSVPQTISGGLAVQKAGARAAADISLSVRAASEVGATMGADCLRGAAPSHAASSVCSPEDAAARMASLDIYDDQ